MAASGHPRAAVSARQRGRPAAAGHGGGAGPGTGSPVLHGRVALALIRDLAMGEWSHASLAKPLGLTADDVKEFAAAHAAEIQEVSAALAGQLAIATAGMWISKQQNRLAEYQAMFEDGQEVINHLRSKPIEDGSGLGSRRHFMANRSQIAILGAVAAELEPRRGQPTDTTETKVVRYIVEGIDPERLM